MIWEMINKRIIFYIIGIYIILAIENNRIKKGPNTHIDGYIWMLDMIFKFIF